MQELREIDLCNFFLTHSISVWNRLAFSRQERIRCTETTVTQNLLFDLWRYAKGNHLPILLYEAQNEAANGNDVELLLETPQGYLLIVLQAKIIKKDGAYRTMPHSVNGTEQIDLLLRYAKERGGCAAYMFYNYVENFEPPGDAGILRLADRADYGCTVAGARLLKDQYYIRRGKNAWRIPTFESLHMSLAVPLHVIICTTLKSPLLDEALLTHIGYDRATVKLYDYAEVVQDPYWKSMLPSAAIGRVSPEYIENAPTTEQVSYMPKYRIILLREPRKRYITFIS